MSETVEQLPTDVQQTPSQPVKEERTYAVLQETSGEEAESWLYFIKYQGNEEALAHLSKQLDKVDWYIVDDLSTFDLETSYLVSERTAKEMTKIDLNHYSFHRKFDGTLKKIDLGFKDSHSNVKKMTKAFDVLGYGRIEEFIDLEDIDPEDLADPNEKSDSSSESDSEDESSTESSSESSSETSSQSSSKSEEDKKPERKKGAVPKVAAKKFEVPRFAKAKAKHRNK